ncbi:MAG TPA: 50S ribosomal protein L30 [Deltaproteobacteria bacterium]|nr:50S ribosomal protein L30 [Deltaproteobacteria bacterium]
MSKFLKIELLHGAIARDQRQKDTLRGLGLRRRHQQRILQDTPAIRGMIRKVFDLVRYETAASAALPKREATVTYRLGPKPETAAAKAPSKTQAKKAAASGDQKKAAAGKKQASVKKAAKAVKPAVKKTTKKSKG